jgi:3-phytase
VGVPVVAACLLSGACAAGSDDQDAPTIPVIPAEFQTGRDTLENVDSPAVWHGPDGEHWLLATAKEGNAILVADAATGQAVRRVGTAGADPGQMARPNGIAVADDVLFVVERDNARVQVFVLPDFRPAGLYGTGDLRRPYGIAVARDGGGAYRTWITDNYETAEETVPPDGELGQRVREYRVTLGPGGLDARLMRTFGDTVGPGVLRVVESIAVDAARGRLLIAEETEGASLIKEYTTEGRFTGRSIPATWFPHQAEGIVLYACEETAGYWIATDQGTAVNTFHVFDRETLGHLGSFQGEGVLNTDGIALTQRPLPGYPAGAFYAVHDDGSVAGLSWTRIATALGLRSDCQR